MTQDLLDRTGFTVRQTLQAAVGGFTADAGVVHACLRKTRPYIGAEQMRPALLDRYVVGGAQTVAQNQDIDFRVIRSARAVDADQHEQDHG